LNEGGTKEETIAEALEAIRKEIKDIDYKIKGKCSLVDFCFDNDFWILLASVLLNVFQLFARAVWIKIQMWAEKK
jgi:hypothetical protein